MTAFGDEATYPGRMSAGLQYDQSRLHSTRTTPESCRGGVNAMPPPRFRPSPSRTHIWLNLSPTSTPIVRSTRDFDAHCAFIDPPRPGFAGIHVPWDLSLPPLGRPSHPIYGQDGGPPRLIWQSQVGCTGRSSNDVTTRFPRDALSAMSSERMVVVSLELGAGWNSSVAHTLGLALLSLGLWLGLGQPLVRAQPGAAKSGV